MSARSPLPSFSSADASGNQDEGGTATLSRQERAAQVEADPALAHSVEPTAILPAAPVEPHQATSLHDPRWAQEEDIWQANRWARFRYVWREELAEALGTAMIVLLGTSVECQTVLHSHGGGDIRPGQPISANAPINIYGDSNSRRLAWAAGVAMAVWTAGGISGAHCNPTVTVALWLFRGFPRAKVGWYIVAQVLGATMATLLVYANYQTSIALFEGHGTMTDRRTVVGPNSTASLFFTFPQPWLSSGQAWLSEALASGVLISTIFALSDRGNLPTPKGTMALAMFVTLIGIGASMGVNTGYALNGARDTGPRLALWLLGYGNAVWSHDRYYWLLAPWFGAIVGGCLGGLVYDTMIYTGRDSWVNRPVRGRGKGIARRSTTRSRHDDDEEQQGLLV